MRVVVRAGTYPTCGQITLGVAPPATNRINAATVTATEKIRNPACSILLSTVFPLVRMFTNDEMPERAASAQIADAKQRFIADVARFASHHPNPSCSNNPCALAAKYELTKNVSTRAM
jgi:hypothetical protein